MELCYLNFKFLEGIVQNNLLTQNRILLGLIQLEVYNIHWRLSKSDLGAFCDDNKNILTTARLSAEDVTLFVFKQAYKSLLYYF